MPSENIFLAKARRLGFVSLLLFTACGTERGPKQPEAPSFSVAETLRPPSTSGYARALKPRPFQFPADHGSHPDFRTEWWYFTGNLATAEGRSFGYQVTFFRSALAPPSPPLLPRPSAWATRQAWLGHFALGDVENRHFHAFEIWGREALGLAGATSDPLRVWLRGWSAEGLAPGDFPLRLLAEGSEAEGSGERVAIDLRLESGTPPVPQGENGLSRKSAEKGNASYYYSLPRMPTRGEIVVGGRRHAVSGLSWMDREWSTSALGKDQVGWDWFSLQLSDGRELMLYRLRHRDGSADPASSGTLIDRAGRPRSIAADAVRIEKLGDWKSEGSGATYPSGWRLHLPSEGLDLTVEPLLKDQELRLSFRYWEGAVRVKGTSGPDAAPLRGQGFVELTGY